MFSIIFELTSFANNEGSVKVHNIMHNFLKSVMRWTLLVNSVDGSQLGIRSSNGANSGQV